jgi:hypothetical protein
LRCGSEGQREGKDGECFNNIFHSSSRIRHPALQQNLRPILLG